MVMSCMLYVQVFIQAADRDRHHWEVSMQMSLQFHDYCLPASNRDDTKPASTSTDTCGVGGIGEGCHSLVHVTNAVISSPLFMPLPEQVHVWSIIYTLNINCCVLKSCITVLHYMTRTG